MFRKNKLAMLVGEFLGTAGLTLAVMSVLISPVAAPYFISIAVGLMLVALVMALSGISGAVFNPALTLGLWTVRKMQAVQAISYIIVQFAGAMAAKYLFDYLTGVDLAKNGFDDAFEPKVMVGEVVGTFIFSFVLAGAIYQRVNANAKAAAAGIGLTVGTMVASLASAAVLNPAIAWSVHRWGLTTYVLGPVLGAILGFNLYNLLFVETEVAEVDEVTRTSSAMGKLDSALSHSLVAQEYDAKKDTLEDKVKVSGSRTHVRTSAGTKKAVAKKKSPGKSTRTKTAKK